MFSPLIGGGQLQPGYHFVLIVKMLSSQEVKLCVPCNFIGSQHLGLPEVLFTL